uniref:Uncharacterized protein n=1 Tax=Caenorhabditis tropicalis TaxID=1561998 RepID=A0A1I7V3H7_9PELO
MTIDHFATENVVIISWKNIFWNVHKGESFQFLSCGVDVIERVIVEERDRIINGYKRALHLKTETPFGPCCICDTYKDHAEGNCLRFLGGYYFKKQAQQAVESKVFPKFENYLKLIQEESFTKNWEKKNPGVPCDLSAVNTDMETHANKNTELRKKKHEEVEKLIEHHNKILGNKLIRYREHFIKNFMAVD